MKVQLRPVKTAGAGENLQFPTLAAKNCSSEWGDPLVGCGGGCG